MPDCTICCNCLIGCCMAGCLFWVSFTLNKPMHTPNLLLIVEYMKDFARHAKKRFDMENAISDEQLFHFDEAAQTDKMEQRFLLNLI